MFQFASLDGVCPLRAWQPVQALLPYDFSSHFSHLSNPHAVEIISEAQMLRNFDKTGLEKKNKKNKKRKIEKLRVDDRFLCLDAGGTVFTIW